MYVKREIEKSAKNVIDRINKRHRPGCAPRWKTKVTHKLSEE